MINKKKDIGNHFKTQIIKFNHLWKKGLMVLVLEPTTLRK